MCAIAHTMLSAVGASDPYTVRIRDRVQESVRAVAPYAAAAGVERPPHFPQWEDERAAGLCKSKRRIYVSAKRLLRIHCA